MNSCSIQLRIHVYDLYSVANVYPYFTQSFYILSSTNISQFSLPSLPSYVKYISSKSNEISIDEINGSIAIQSPSLFSSYSYDFYIQAINSQTPSLSCSIPIRIFFGINRQSPRLVQNLTKQSIEIPSLTSDFIYQIQAYDPDLSLDNQYKLFPPSIHTNISQFSLPSLPSYVKYISSKSNEISIDEINGSIAIQAPSLFSSYSYDFYIQAINSQTPSLSCSIPIRIFFGINRQSPRLVQNLTKQSIEIPSLTSDFIYQIQAYDPDLSLDNQYKLFPPSIQYEIDSSENLDIER
ncbi:unnamed protein product, partial [Adineta steineri]